MNTVDIGHHAENQACDYLTQHGLALVTKNYRIRLGEIDLIMQDGDTMVFIEVRYRSHLDFGTPAATINRAKQQKIIKAAKYYLVSRQLYDKIYCRFDVITITAQMNRPDQIEWLKDAFSAY